MQFKPLLFLFEADGRPIKSCMFFDVAVKNHHVWLLKLRRKTRHGDWSLFAVQEFDCPLTIRPLFFPPVLASHHLAVFIITAMHHQ